VSHFKEKEEGIYVQNLNRSWCWLNQNQDGSIVRFHKFTFPLIAYKIQQEGCTLSVSKRVLTWHYSLIGKLMQVKQGILAKAPNLIQGA
jgi:hypothetical protein